MKKFLFLSILFFLALLTIKLKILSDEHQRSNFDYSNVVISLSQNSGSVIESSSIPDPAIDNPVILTKRLDKITNNYQKTLNVFTIIWVIGFIISFIILYLILHK